VSKTGAVLLFQAVARLRPVLGQGAARDARVLLAYALDVAADRLTLVLPDPVSDEQAARFETCITARLRRRPVSQIVGYRLFWGHEFQVTGDVLDPRPETESLIALALAAAKPENILDLGVGSGCILLTLLAEWPEAQGVGADFSAAACAVAQSNAERLGVAARAEIIWSDWYENISGQFDLIVSNPPYITGAEMAALEPEVAQWEPEMALTPGGDGLEAYRILAAGLECYLTQTGTALFEIGHRQGQAVAAVFVAAGFTDIRVFPDLSGHDRIVRVRR